METIAGRMCSEYGIALLLIGGCSRAGKGIRWNFMVLRAASH